MSNTKLGQNEFYNVLHISRKYMKLTSNFDSNLIKSIINIQFHVNQHIQLFNSKNNHELPRVFSAKHGFWGFLI